MQVSPGMEKRAIAVGVGVAAAIVTVLLSGCSATPTWQAQSHYVMRYYGGPKSPMWPAPVQSP